MRRPRDRGLDRTGQRFYGHSADQVIIGIRHARASTQPAYDHAVPITGAQNRR